MVESDKDTTAGANDDEADARKALEEMECTSRPQGIPIAEPAYDSDAFVHAVEEMNACQETALNLENAQTLPMFKVDEDVLDDKVVPKEDDSE